MPKKWSKMLIRFYKIGYDAVIGFLLVLQHYCNFYHNLNRLSDEKKQNRKNISPLGRSLGEYGPAYGGG